MIARFNKLGSWDSMRSVPYYFFYYYVPTRYSMLSSESEYIRKEVWNFKNGIHQDLFIDHLEKKIKHTFERPNFLTLVCIPASTRKSNKARFENFSNVLCKKIKYDQWLSVYIYIERKVSLPFGGQ